MQRGRAQRGAHYQLPARVISLEKRKKGKKNFTNPLFEQNINLLYDFRVECFFFIA